MKLIDNPDYFEIQSNWFLTQVEKSTGVYSFVNYAKAQVQFKEIRGAMCMDLNEYELSKMREALTPKGLVRLSKALLQH